MIWGFIITAGFFYILGQVHGRKAFRDTVKENIKSWIG